LLEKPVFTEFFWITAGKKPAFSIFKLIIAGKARIYWEKKQNDCWKNQHFTENNLIIAGMVKSTTSLLLVG